MTKMLSPAIFIFIIRKHFDGFKRFIFMAVDPNEECRVLESSSGGEVGICDDHAIQEPYEGMEYHYQKSVFMCSRSQSNKSKPN